MMYEYLKVYCSKYTYYTKSVAHNFEISWHSSILDIFPWDIKDFVSRRSGQAGIFRYSPNLRGAVLHDPVVDMHHQYSVGKRLSYIPRKNKFCKKKRFFFMKKKFGIVENWSQLTVFLKIGLHILRDWSTIQYRDCSKQRSI